MQGAGRACEHPLCGLPAYPASPRRILAAFTDLTGKKLKNSLDMPIIHISPSMDE